MKKFVGIAGIIICLFAMLGISVSAESEIVITESACTGRDITISGTLTEVLGETVSYVVTGTDGKVYALGESECGENSFSITFTMPQSAPYGKYTAKIGAVKTTPVDCLFEYSDNSSISIKHTNTYMIFEEGESITVTAELLTSSWDNNEVNLQIVDYYGNTVYEGNTVIGENNRDAVFEVGNLERGHYIIYASYGEIKASENMAVVMPLSERGKFEYSSVAVDSSSFGNIPKDRVSDYVDALKKAGVKTVHERVSLGRIYNQSTGEFDFSYMQTHIDEYYKAGIEVVCVLNINGDGEGGKITKDMSFAYNAAKKTAEHFGDKVSVWEVYNEPDLFLAENEGSEKYASLVKAMALGFRDGCEGVKVSIGGLSALPYKNIERYFQSGIGDYFDIYNYHYHTTYSSKALTEYKFSNINHLKMIENYNLPNTIYVTEAGMYIPVYDSADITRDEQIRQARFMPASMVKSLSQGVDKHFWFVMPYYIEGSNSLGTFSSTDTPYMAYSAVSACTEALGGAKYAGAITNLPDGVEGYVFKKSDTSVACFWSLDETEVSVKLNRDAAIMTDIMGRSSSVVSTDGIFKFTSGPDIKYLTISGEYPEMELEKTVNETEKRYGGKISDKHRIVLFQNFDSKASEVAKSDSYKLSATESNTVTVDVYNFSDEAKSVTVTAKTYVGWTVSPSETAVTVEPMSKTTVAFTITAQESVSSFVGVPLVFGGTCGGEKITDSVSYISSYTEDMRIEPSVIVPGYDNPSNWEKSFPATDKLSLENTENGVIKGNL